MLTLSALPRAAGGIRIVARGGSAIDGDAPVDGPFALTSISRLGAVRLAGAAADEWLSSRLSSPVRLAWLDDPCRRPVSPSHGGRAGEPLSLADAGPLLLTSETSLRELNRWISQSGGDCIPMTRFRPNVVVDGMDEAFVEDRWARVRVGDVTFRQAEQCDRCMLTLIDPETLTLGKEPLRSLARHRRRDGKVWFGIRLIPESIGHIGVGDEVSALD